MFDCRFAHIHHVIWAIAEGNASGTVAIEEWAMGMPPNPTTDSIDVTEAIKKAQKIALNHDDFIVHFDKEGDE